VRRAHLLALFLAAALVSPARPAAPPGLRPWQPEVKKLIVQLGDDDFRVRDEAERRLRAQSIRILPLLRAAVGSTDPEVRRRAARLIPLIETDALFAPKRINLSVRNKPLQDVFNEISKQSGYKIQHGADREVVSYTFRDAPFWDVIDRICRDHNYTTQSNYGNEVVVLNKANGYAAHVGRSGPFRYVANSFQLYRNVELGLVNPRGGTTASRSESLTLNFTLFAEPRLPFLSLGEVRIDAAYDSENNSMLPPASANGDPFNGGFGVRGFRTTRYYPNGQKQLGLSGSLNLHRPSEKANAVKLLRGVVPVTVLVEQRPVVLADKVLSAKPKKMDMGDITFNLEAVTKTANNQYQVKFTATNNQKGNIHDYGWTNTLYQRMELHDAKGNKYQNWGSSWGSSGNNHVNMTLTFANFNRAGVGDPVKLVYQHWVTRGHEVRFEFRNVPLP
jgi:hypothetical protein